MEMRRRDERDKEERVKSCQWVCRSDLNHAWTLVGLYLGLEPSLQFLPALRGRRLVLLSEIFQDGGQVGLGRGVHLNVHLPTHLGTC